MGLFDFFKKKRSRKETKEKVNTKSKQVTNIRPIVSLRTETITTRHEPEIIPIEKRIKEIKPNEAGLYPHEILLLSYAPTYYVEDKENSFPGFWWYKYGIKDVNKSLRSLKDRGFLQIGSLRSAIEKETVAFLKDILRKNNLKISGKKAELVERLLNEISEEKLKSIFTRYTYELTDAGKEALKKGEHIPYIHRNNIEDLDIWSLSRKVLERPSYSYRDIIWGYLNERSMAHIKMGDFGLYRNCRFTMSEFILKLTGMKMDLKSFI